MMAADSCFFRWSISAEVNRIGPSRSSERLSYRSHRLELGIVDLHYSGVVDQHIQSRKLCNQVLCDSRDARWIFYI